MVVMTLNLRNFCLDCVEYYTDINSKWCKCNSQQFQQDFSNWTSKNGFVDRFIQETQLNAKHNSEVLEWIPYNRLKNIKYLIKEESGIVNRAIWSNGPIKEWSNNERKWIRYNNEIVAFKNLDNSLNSSKEFLNKV